MSAERLVEILGKKLGRRNFLVKLGIGTGGGLIGLIGRSQQVSAGPYCCNLCFPGGGSSCSGCACSWCWTCYFSGSGYYQCCECHDDTSNCGGDSCRNVICSWWNYLGQRPVR